MSEIRVPFNIDPEAEFRFELILKSASVNSHSLLDSGETKAHMKTILESATRDPRFITYLKYAMQEWREKHK